MTPEKPRLVFMGTPDLARTVMRALVESASFEIAAVVAQPDKPVGRGLDLTPPPVKIEALERGLKVMQPTSARDPLFLEALSELRPDVIVVAAYGKILPAGLLEIPRGGCLNVHTSILPRWRGAAPIQWVLLEGDSTTGVTIMRMDAGLDTGDIVATATIPIRDDDTSAVLHDRLATLGASLLLRTLPGWLSGSITAVPQPTEGVTYARKLTKEDGLIDWRLPSVRIWRQVRAFNPWPGAFTTQSESGEAPSRLRIWEALPVSGEGAPGQVIVATGDQWIVGTGEGLLRLLSIQREGRRRLDAGQYLQGSAIKKGDFLGGG